MLGHCESFDVISWFIVTMSKESNKLELIKSERGNSTLTGLEQRQRIREYVEAGLMLPHKVSFTCCKIYSISSKA